MKARIFTVLALFVSLTLLLTLLPGEAAPTAAQGPRLPDFHPPGVSQSGQEVSLSGWFTIIWGDPQPGSNREPVEIYMLTDDTGHSTQLRLTEELAQPFGGVLALNGRRVTIQGMRVDIPTQGAKAIALDVQSIEFDRGAKASAISSNDSVIGSQPWVTILCKFPDIDTNLKPLSYFEGLMGDTYPGLDHYWRELSYNTMDLVGSRIVGWYTLPHPLPDYELDRWCGPPLPLTFDCLAAADADVYFPDYAGINLVFNEGMPAAYGGGEYLAFDGTLQSYGMTWLWPWAYQNQAVVAHEMGHGFGLRHSHGAYYQEYGNQWDVMSDFWSLCDPPDVVYGCVGQHTISYHKDKLGWLASERKYVGASDSQATITLDQLALPQTSDYLMAQIPIQGSATHFYTVEARRKVGYDDPLPGNAVIIHGVDSTGRQATVVDADGNGDTGDAGAMWTVGETFTDAANGISVSVDSATATGFVVTIIVKPMPWQLSPSNGGAVLEGDVTFAWTSVPDASGYQIQIDTTTAFTSPALISATVTSTSYTTILTSGTYYWRIRALPDGAWTAAWELSVGQPVGNWHADEIVYDSTELCGAHRASQIAVDGAGNAYAIWQDCRNISANDWDIYFAYRPTGGSWGANVRVNDDIGSARQDRPAIAVDAAGNAYAVWIDDRNGNGAVYFAYRPAGGNWGTNVQVSDVGSAEEPDIAVDAAGNAYAVWTSGDIYFAYRPAGGSWGGNVRVNDDSGSAEQSAPAIAVDATGNAYAVWVDQRNDAYDIYFSYRPSGGSWGANVWVNDAGSSVRETPDIAVDATGNAYAVWGDLPQRSVYFAYRPAGGSWEGDVRVNDVTVLARFPTIAVDNSGSAYTVWQDLRTGRYNIYFAYRPAGGSWGDNVWVSDAGRYAMQPAIALDTSGNAYAVWHGYMAGDTYFGGIYFAYRPAGGSWGASLRVSDAGGASQEVPAIAVDATGNAYAVWQDSRNNNCDIYFAYRPAGGSWGANMRVNDDTGSADQLRPDIAVDPMGNAYAVWEDLRNDPDGGCDVTTCNKDIYFAYRPAGDNWGGNVRVNDGTSNGLRNPAIAVDPVGNAYAVWWEGEDPCSEGDIHFAYRPVGGSWEGTVRVNDDIGSAFGGLTSPAIAVDPMGNAYAVWEDSRNGHCDIYFAYRPVGGSWDANVQVNDGTNPYPATPDIAVDATGNAYVVWLIDIDHDIYFAYQPSGGSWGANVQVNDDTNSAWYNPAIAVDPMGNAHAVWWGTPGRGSNIYSAYRAAGGGWGPNVRVNDDIGVANRSSPDIAVDTAGNGYAVWPDDRNTDYTTWHTYFSYVLTGTPCVLFGDLDGDGDVDVEDIMKVASRWRMTSDDPGWDARYDLDGDGIITVVDIMLVVVHWGETCG